jgi:hypothetical protein
MLDIEVRSKMVRSSAGGGVFRAAWKWRQIIDGRRMEGKSGKSLGMKTEEAVEN